MKISENKKKKGVYCCAYSCTNTPVARKGGLCHKHYRRLQRFRDPVQVRYNGFKGNAKKRNIINSVTLAEFRIFCDKNRYVADINGNPFKGNRGQNATIDRRCNVHGYHIWNMQIMSNSANASKGNRFNGDNFDCPF